MKSCWGILFSLFITFLCRAHGAESDALAFRFSAPNLAQFVLGGDSEESRHLAIDADFGLPQGTRVRVGVESSWIKDADTKDLNSSGLNLGLQTDPLNLWTGIFSLSAWRLGDDLKGQRVAAGVGFAPRDWYLELTLAGERLKLSSIPSVLFPPYPADEIRGSSVEALVEWLRLSPWTLYTRGRVANYDQDLDAYSLGLRVIFMPQEVLTSTASLQKSEIAFGLRYAANRWRIGVEAGSSQTILDELRTSQLTISGGWSLSRVWELNLSLGASRPQNAQEDSDPLGFVTMGASYSWY